MAINKVVGLRPQGDRPSVGGANRRRVNVPTAAGIRGPGITPTARPVDTYSRPQAPQQGNDALQFAQALSSISPGLRDFLDQEQSRKQEHETARAERRLGGMTYEESAAAMAAGMPEMENPYFRAAAMKQFGEQQAYHRINELTTAYATEFDPATGDLDAFISSKMAEDLEQYGEDRYFVSSYTALMDDFRANAMTKDTQNKSALAVEDAKGGVFDVFLGTAQQMRDAGKTPEEITAAIRTRYQGNQDLLNISAADQDAEFMRVVDVFAQQGDLEMVTAMLNQPRTGPNGEDLGPMSATRLFAADAAKLAVTAENKRNEANQDKAFASVASYMDQADKGVLNPDELAEYRAANPGAISDERALSLISASNANLERAQQAQATNAARIEKENMSILAQDELRSQNLKLGEIGQTPFLKPTQLPDANGEMKPVTVDQQNEWLAEDIVNRTQALVTSGEITPEQAFDLQIERFATAGIENPQWQNVLSAGMIGANAWSISGNDTAPPALVEGAKMYMELYAKSPQLLGMHLKDAETKRFYEQYRVAVQRGGMEPQQAYSHAVAVTKLPPIDNPLTGVSRSDLEAILGRIGNGNGGWFGMGNGEANNQAYVAQEIVNGAAYYSAGGTLTGAAAAQEAEKDFLNTHQNINGQWINTADRHIPANFDEMAKQVIADYARDFGEDPNELTIRPSTNGTGAWEIIHKGPLPMSVDDAARRNVTLGAMAEGMAVKAEADAAALVVTQAETQASEEKLRFEQLKTELAAAEAFLNTESYQYTFAARNGQDALEAEMASTQARVAAHKAELARLQHAADLRLVEAQTPAKPSVNLDLLQ